MDRASARVPADPTTLFLEKDYAVPLYFKRDVRIILIGAPGTTFVVVLIGNNLVDVRLIIKFADFRIGRFFA